MSLDRLHHVAIAVTDIAAAATWYTETFSCQVSYQDETWAMIDFENTQLALVVAAEHPPHIAVERPDAEKFGDLTPHRDGSRSIYIEDSSGNPVELIAPATRR